MPTPATKPKTLGQVQREAAKALGNAGIDTSALDARLLLCHAAAFSHEELVSRSQDVMPSEVEQAYGDLIDRRIRGEPVGRILGRREFWGLEFQLGSETLEPRADSEAIIASVLGVIEDVEAPLRILDLGTGSGCLLLSLLHECLNASGVGIDISAEALRVAIENAKHLGLTGRASFQEGNWSQGLSGAFDVAVSNPPYIPTSEIEILSREVRDHDPVRALDGGADGMECYRKILAQLPAILVPGGIAAIETSPDLYTELRTLVEMQPEFQEIETIEDMAGRFRGLRFRKRHLAP